MECGSHILFVGEIQEIHADPSCLTDKKPDIAKINPLIYAQAAYFGVGKEIEKAFWPERNTTGSKAEIFQPLFLTWQQDLLLPATRFYGWRL